MPFSTFNTIHIRNKSSKCRSIIINNYNTSNTSNFNHCDIDKLIQAVTDKIPSSVLKDRLILEYYETLYNEVIIHINEILDTFQNSTIEEVLKLYNHDSFLFLISKIATIKNNLIANFCHPDNLPKFVNIFIDNYVENIYNLLYSFTFMIRYIGNFNNKKKCCEILSSLESIKEYVNKYYGGKQDTSMMTASVIRTPIKLKEPYNTYVIRHGLPDNGVFITSLLADITAELGI